MKLGSSPVQPHSPTHSPTPGSQLWYCPARTRICPYSPPINHTASRALHPMTLMQVHKLHLQGRRGFVQRIKPSHSSAIISPSATVNRTCLGSCAMQNVQRSRTTHETVALLKCVALRDTTGTIVAVTNFILRIGVFVHEYWV